MVLMVLVGTFIKTGSPHFFKCGVRLNRDYFNFSSCDQLLSLSTFTCSSDRSVADGGVGVNPEMAS